MAKQKQQEVASLGSRVARFMGHATAFTIGFLVFLLLCWGILFVAVQITKLL